MAAMPNPLQIETVPVCPPADCTLEGLSSIYKNLTQRAQLNKGNSN